MTTIYK